MNHVAVVGASLAGLSAVTALRAEGFDGRLTVIDRSEVLPPDRPPLSKSVLAGSAEPGDATQPGVRHLGEMDVELLLGTTVTALSAGDLVLSLEGGAELRPDGIVLAVGATPRRLRTELAGVHVLRDMEDCLAIRAELDQGPRRVVVVGAGFIGSEVAATCRGRGLDVTMVETLPRPLQRVMPGPIGDFVADLHRAHGVDVRLGVGVEQLDGGRRVESVRLTDGTVLDADVVVAGIGVTPDTTWLEGSGLGLDDGILCDGSLLAAPGIVAAGDAARWPNGAYGEVMRVEQWENAIEQGGYAGRRLLAGEGAVVEPYSPIPWFWSDQYDRKIQLAGRIHPDDEVEVVEGSPEDRRFVAVARRGDRCVAVLGVNRPRHVVQLRLRMAEPGGLAWEDALALF